MVPMNSEEDIPPGAMNGVQLPQRVPGRRLQWVGTLPPPVRREAGELTSTRRGDAVTFIEASRRAGARQGNQPC